MTTTAPLLVLVLLARAVRRYPYLSGDPTRTDEEDRELRELTSALDLVGYERGLPPIERDGDFIGT